MIMHFIQQRGIVVLTATSLIHKTTSLVLHHSLKSCDSLHFQSSATKVHSVFLGQVEDTIHRVKPDRIGNIEYLQPHRRESIVVASRLNKRIKSLHRNNDCPRCWLQRAHCICSQTPPIQPDIIPKNINRLFIIMHHKEICMVVDTAKLLLNSMPSKAKLVVNGIGEEYQESMVEMMDAIHNYGNKKGGARRCIVLFPTDDARTFEDLCCENTDELGKMERHEHNGKSRDIGEGTFDVIVMDGTWAQARKMHSKYIPSEMDGGPPRVCLSQESLDILGGVNEIFFEGNEKGGNGRQLRRHPIKWKEVSTLEATRLLFRDMMSMGDKSLANRNGKQFHEILREYQQISDTAAIKQLGPPRTREAKISNGL